MHLSLQAIALINKKIGAVGVIQAQCQAMVDRERPSCYPPDSRPSHTTCTRLPCVQHHLHFTSIACSDDTAAVKQLLTEA